jgi:hypothetical protein
MNALPQGETMANTAKTPPVVIFLHAPKTGGTTLVRIIERQFASGSVLNLYDSSYGEELAAYPADEIHRLRAVVGHFYFGVHAFIPRPSFYITLLRDPVDRVISHYHFVRREPGHYLHQAANELSLREFVVACGADEPNNDQTRLLAGRYQAEGNAPCAGDMLAAAKRNLREHIAVVGLTEEFDRSLLLMRRTFGWGKPFYVRENVTKKLSRRELVSPETRSVIQDYNALDQEIYDDARSLFKERVRGQDASFQHELNRFRKLNSLYVLTSNLRRLANLNASSGTR